MNIFSFTLCTDCDYLLVRNQKCLLKVRGYNVLSDPGKPGVRSMGPGVFNKQQEVFEALTDVILAADEDTNSMVTDNANRTIQGKLHNLQVANNAMQVAPPDDQILNQCNLCHLVAKYATSASDAILWSNLQLMRVLPSGGQICNLC